MAGFLDSLMSMIGMGQPQSYEISPGLTIGPGVSRVTRTPIIISPTNLKTGGVEAAGHYVDPPQGLDRIPAAITHITGLDALTDMKPNNIYVNPKGTTDLKDYNDTISHESIHAVRGMDPTSFDNAAHAAPGYDQLAQQITQRGFGNPSAEVPAFMRSGYEYLQGTTPSTRSTFMRGMINNLPQAQANLMQKLGQPPQSMPATDNSENRNRY